MYFLLHPISSLNHLIARLVTDQITLIASIIFFTILALNYKKPFWQRLDERVANWATNNNKSLIKDRSEDFAICGNALFHILFSVILFIVFLLVRHKLSMAITILFVLIFSWGLNRFMKLVFKRVRPEHINSSVRRRLSYCFPSGHIMASISIYFFSAVILQGLISFLPWYIIALVVSYLVVMTRIYLNHHYFTDVLGGIAMGIFCLNISIWFYFFIGLI